jgi:hypothetical protein
VELGHVTSSSSWVLPVLMFPGILLGNKAGRPVPLLGYLYR